MWSLSKAVWRCGKFHFSLYGFYRFPQTFSNPRMINFFSSLCKKNFPIEMSLHTHKHTRDDDKKTFQCSLSTSTSSSVRLIKVSILFSFFADWNWWWIDWVNFEGNDHRCPYRKLIDALVMNEFKEFRIFGLYKNNLINQQNQPQAVMILFSHECVSKHSCCRCIVGVQHNL